MQTVTVLQGECHVTSEPTTVLSTVLGSCVAVCLNDSVAKVGGMNHFLLPAKSDQGHGDLRYGIHSMELLINDLLKIGARKSRFTAQLFGGASVMKTATSIGRSNGNFATEFLAREGIQCVGQDLGGTQARRIKFFATTGRVENRRVPGVFENDKARAPARVRKDSDITLF